MAELATLKINVTGIPGIKEMVEKLAKVAAEDCCYDDEDFSEVSASFEDGVNTGYVLFARELLTLWKNEKEEQNEQY